MWYLCHDIHVLRLIHTQGHVHAHTYNIKLANAVKKTGICSIMLLPYMGSRVKLRPLGLHGKHLYLLSHFSAHRCLCLHSKCFYPLSDLILIFSQSFISWMPCFLGPRTTFPLERVLHLGLECHLVIECLSWHSQHVGCAD